MPSSLAAQLAKGVSLNAPLLSETARKKHFASSSYLFSSSTKGQIDDLDSIYALAANALAQLRLIYPSFAAFNDSSQVHRSLFSQRAKDTDRTLLANEELKELNDAIRACLMALGPCLLEEPAGRILEWLVRRFRVNEFNVPDVLALFLPYHESPHFAKMVSILTIDEAGPWRCLAPYKAAGKALPRSALVTEMRKDSELARYVVALLPSTLEAMDGANVHRTLICFNTSVVLEYITRSDKKDLDAGTLAFLLPALLEPLKVGEPGVPHALLKDRILGSYVLISALSQKCTFTSAALKSVASTMVHSACVTSAIGATQLVTALISFLSAQETLDSITDSVVDELVALPDILRALRASFGWSGVEKVVIPTLKRLLEKCSEEPYATVLDLLLVTDRAPETILKPLTKLLLRNASGKYLLTAMYQRHPDTLRACVDELVAEDEEKRLELEHVLLNLVMPEGSGKAPRDIILAASNADPSVRASAVRHVAQLIDGDAAQELNPTELIALQDALRARVYDANPAVLDALYASPAAVIPLLASANAISALATSLTAQTAPRAVLRAHLAFFCGAVYARHPDLGTQVLLELVLPHALFSKPRGKTAASVWEVVAASSLGGHKLLKGVIEVVKAAGESLGVEEMMKLNIALTKKLADNFKTSDDYPTLLTWLIGGIADEGDAHKRLLALLVTRALLADLTGEHKVDAAYKVLQPVGVADMSDLGKLGDDDLFDEISFEETLSKGVVLKPSSRLTTQRLQLSILASIPSIRSSDQMDWFCHDKVNDQASLGHRYLHLLRSAYSIINTTVSNLSIVAHANQELFENLGTDSLLFLAGLWTKPSPSVRSSSDVDSDATRYVALRHASAFLRAKTTENPVDFQAVVPALLSAIQSRDRKVRGAALECVAILAASSSATKPAMVYAYDQVYGSVSATLQYLDWSDEGKYLMLLSEHRDHLINDAEYLISLHYEYLSSSKAENKKDAKQRQRILCFLLSHVVCSPSLEIRLSILRAMRQVSDGVKLQMLLPIIEEHLDAPSPIADSELATLSLEAFDSSAAKDLNVDESRSWSVLLRALQHYHSLGKITSEWTSLCISLRASLFASLSNKRQVEISLKLIELASEMDDDFGVKQLLGSCVKQPALVTALLQALQPNVGTLNRRASKRAKTDIPPSDPEKSAASHLALLAEVLSSQVLPGSLELVSGLLDTLSRIVATSAPVQADLIYVEQLLMSSIDSSASQIKELPNLAPSAIRLDVLVELMRTSENPQTFHQALLLMASLARLSPESVLHNVMPIFTFMGSNVFHRDDSYSFKVIQKTTESIVPVATASLKQKHNNTLDLFIGSRDLIRTFTDAFTHIPRHRRTSFFTHLVDVLGPADFLAPVIMLLADKSSNRVSRQDRQEAQLSLVLPLGILHHYDSSVEFSAMKEVVQEVQRLVRAIRDPTSPEKNFLEAIVADEQSVPSSTLRKRQCQTLLTLVGLGMKQISERTGQEPSNDLRDVITALLELATADENDIANVDLQDIGSSAQWALLQSMGIISVAYFSSAVLSMLSMVFMLMVLQIQQGALGLLAARVPEMKAEVREAVSSVMTQIVNRIKDILPSALDSATISESMRALLSIGSSSCAKEEFALTSVVPIVIDIINKHPETQQAIGCHSCTDVRHYNFSFLCTIAHAQIYRTRLGPRIIPYLRSLVETSVSSLKLYSAASNQELTTQGLHTLSCLLKGIPMFWGAQEVKLVADLYVDGETALSKGSSSQLEKLVKLLAKQLPSKTLLSSLLQCWPPIEDLTKPNGVSRFGRFFELLKRCLHFSARADVLESLRGLFNNFLQAFSARSGLAHDDACSLENKIISAYLELVVKLNETAFQPLFRRSCDWAFSDDSSSDRKITFCRLYSALLDLFKELMTPYMSLLISNFVDVLESFQKEENANKELWFATIETLSKSFAVDEGVYWRDGKLRLVSGPLIQQIPVCVNLKTSQGKTLLSECLSALVECLEDDSSVKAVNLAVLMHSRSDDRRVRLFALSCSVTMWQAHSAKLRGFGSETATFIMECAEDENDDIVR
ncbi:hypothetical protein DFH11DRAFT_1788270 [Phellopilus nigrolimitatus]|nr:hypothetical protein DFH11DRAFT_1788270 [Phellopilus nigrolimitatus]